MATRDPPWLSLLAHPDFPSKGVRRVAARLELVGQESLRFQYVLEADPLLVRIPSPVTDAARADKLWAHTCFEAFIALAQSPRYLELNFSPSGQWAAYGFDAYRQGMAPALQAPPRLAVRRCGERLELQAEVPMGGLELGKAPENLRLRMALSAIVEDREGSLSYWALRHPPGRPDFHHADSFSLALELPSYPLNSP